MQDTTSHNNTHQKKSKTLGIKYFYELYVKEKQKFPNNKFTNQKVRSKKKRVATLKEYKKVILTFLTIYFYELYFNKKPKYFFLGGFAKIVTYHSWQRRQKRGNNNKKELHKSNNALGIFWYFRPSQRINSLVVLKKLTGSTNRLPKIEADFLKTNDKDLLPIFTSEIKKHITNKTLFRCIQT